MLRIKTLETHIFRLLNIETGEETKVKLLLLQSFFIGVFYAVFDITAQSIFLDSFDSSMTSIAIFISGGFGLLITSLYSRLLRIMKFSVLLIINFSFILLALLLMRGAYYFIDSKWLSFLVFIMLGPLNLISIVGFWGMVGKLFTLRQGKRLFGMIDSGQIFGMIISSFAVPYFLLKLVNNVTVNLLYISAISIAIALITQIIITRKFNINTEELKKKGTREKDEKKFIALFNSRYVALMSLFIILSMVVAFFILFSFMSVTQSRYPDPVEKANFISLVGAVAMIFSFLFKTFVYSKFINTYGLKAGLLLMPIVLGLFAIISAIVGSLMGYSVESSSFMIFFLIIVLSRLMSISLKSSIEVPTFKVLYQSLDLKIRHRVQAGIDGVINEFAAIFAGLILFVLGLLSFFEIIHYSLFLAFLIVIWLFITFRLHREYKKALENTLRLAQIKEDENSETKQKRFNHELSQSENYLYFLKLTNMLAFEKQLVNKINTPSFNANHLAAIKELGLFDTRKEITQLIESTNNQELKEIALSITEEINILEDESKDSKLINKLLTSIDANERAKAAKLIGFSKDKNYLNNLAVLLRDIIPDVKIAAIKAAAKLKSKELFLVLIELLEEPMYYPYAYDALNSIGNPTLDALELGFHKTGQSNQVLIRIIYLMGNIGGQKAESYLLSKVNMHNKDITIASLQALRKLGYNVSNQEASRQLGSILKQSIFTTAWNLNIKVHLNKNEVSPLLLDAIQEEIQENYELLFLILSLMYDPNSIDHVKSNINKGSSESISFAVELLEILLDEDIKPLLFPLLEDLTENEKVRRLQNHFSLNRYNNESALDAILNRDNNNISKWVKVCALDSYNYLNGFSANDAIKAHIFNKDNILKETSAILLYHLSKKEFENCVNRLEFKEERYLKNFVNASKDNKSHLLLEKVLYLKKNNLFKELSNDILCDIALHMEFVQADADQILFPKLKSKHLPIFMLIDGKINIEQDKELIDSFIDDQIITKYFLTDNKKIIFKTERSSEFYKLSYTSLNILLSKYKSFQNAIINNFI